MGAHLGLSILFIGNAVDQRPQMVIFGFYTLRSQARQVDGRRNEVKLLGNTPVHTQTLLFYLVTAYFTRADRYSILIITTETTAVLLLAAVGTDRNFVKNLVTHVNYFGPFYYKCVLLLCFTSFDNYGKHVFQYRYITTEVALFGKCTFANRTRQ